MYGYSCPTTASCPTRWRFRKNQSGEDMPCFRILRFMKPYCLEQMFPFTCLVIQPLRRAVFTLEKMKTGDLPSSRMVRLSFAGTIGSHRLFIVTTGTQV